MPARTVPKRSPNYTRLEPNRRNTARFISDRHMNTEARLAIAGVLIIILMGAYFDLPRITGIPSIVVAAVLVAVLGAALFFLLKKKGG